MPKAQPKKIQQQVVAMNRFNISEGLSRKSLEHLVQPMISVDEFQSKISDKRCIVVGFYCSDKDPARDLSHFIDRSSEPVLDTEVSPAPTTDGYYVVWVEIQRDKKFPQVLLDILKEVDNLADVNEWQFQCPGHSNPADVNKKNLENYIVLNQDKIPDPPEEEPEEEPVVEPEEEPVVEPEEEPAKEEPAEGILQEFWQSANVDYVIVEKNSVTLQRYGNKYTFNFTVDIPDNMALLSEGADARQLQNLIGPMYAVYATKDGLVVENDSISLFVTPAD